MKRLLILLVLALPAYGQIINPGIPCSGGNCTVSGNLTVTGAAYVGAGTPNDTSTGTVNIQGAKTENVAGVVKLIACGNSDTQVPCLPVVKGAGTTGNAYQQQGGELAVVFDNTTVVGDCVVMSTTAAPKYHDTGSTNCGGQWGLGYATTAGTGTQSVFIIPQQPGGTIASGTAALGTGAIASGACATAVQETTVTVGLVANVLTTDVIAYTPNADPTAVTGYAVSATGSLYIWAYPTAGHVNFKVCNNTSGSLTPAALTLNWRVAR